VVQGTVPAYAYPGMGMVAQPQPLMQPQPMLQPMMQPMMQPVLQPIMQPMPMQPMAGPMAVPGTMQLGSLGVAQLAPAQQQVQQAAPLNVAPAPLAHAVRPAPAPGAAIMGTLNGLRDIIKAHQGGGVPVTSVMTAAVAPLAAARAAATAPKPNTAAFGSKVQELVKQIKTAQTR